MQCRKPDNSYTTPAADETGKLYARTVVKDEHQIATSADGNTVYKRDWSGTGTGIIRKQVSTTDGTDTVWTFYHGRGTWANRASITYVANDVTV